MILPLLEYCNFIFNSDKKSRLDKIDNVQYECKRIIEYCQDISNRRVKEMSGLGKNNSKRTSCTKLVDENDTQYETQKASEYLNNYYVNVGPNLANSLDIEWDKSKCKIQVDNVFNFTWKLEREVVDLVKNIKISKSCAIDGLSTRIIKDAFLILPLELTYMYNICLQKGIFSSSWCISMVTPIPKTKTKSTNAGDWRPISQISLPGKLLEKIVHSQLYYYLQLKHLLSDRQFGFRKRLSTNLAIFDVLTHSRVRMPQGSPGQG